MWGYTCAYFVLFNTFYILHKFIRGKLFQSIKFVLVANLYFVLKYRFLTFVGLLMCCSLVCMEEFSVGTSCHIFYQRHQVDKFSLFTVILKMLKIRRIYFLFMASVKMFIKFPLIKTQIAPLCSFDVSG